VIAAVMFLTAIAIVLYPDTSAVIWLRAIQVLTWVVLLGIGPRLYEERRQLLSLGLALITSALSGLLSAELERYRDSLRPIPWLMTIVSVSGLALRDLCAKNRSTLIPLGLLMVLIAAGLYLRMRSQAPKIQTELEDLRRIRSESQ
jgi:hypothetical protein